MYVTRSLFISFYWFLCLFLTRLWRHDGKRITLFFPFPAHLHFNEQSLIFYAAACGLKALFIVIWEWKAEKPGRPRQRQQLGVASASPTACRGQPANRTKQTVNNKDWSVHYENTKRWRQNICITKKISTQRMLWNKSVPILNLVLPARPAVSAGLAGSRAGGLIFGQEMIFSFLIRGSAAQSATAQHYCELLSPASIWGLGSKAWSQAKLVAWIMFDQKFVWLVEHNSCL